MQRPVQVESLPGIADFNGRLCQRAPQNGVHALQLEIAQRAYMSEKSCEYDTARAAKLRDTLRQMLSAYLAAARD